MKEEYCRPTSRCKSDKTWKAEGENLLKNERILFIIGYSEFCVSGNVFPMKIKINEDFGTNRYNCLAATLPGRDLGLKDG